MSAPLARLNGRRPVRWTTILGLILVPLTVAGVLLWGLWNPTKRLENVTAAVVNVDEPVTVNGQLTPLGRLLAGELVKGGKTPDSASSGSDGAASAGSGSGTGIDADTNFTWVLTDADDAKAGLDDGRYATVVTIPESFSAAATSASEGPDKVTQATIDIAESDRGRLLDSAISGIVTQTATNLLNKQLGEQFVGNVFVGMSELGDGIGSAADGADQLADGTKQLASGADQLADGTKQLADGTGQLASGATQLSSGASQLAGGASQLSGGMNLFVNGDGTAANPGLRGFVDAASQFSAGYAPLAAGTIATAEQLKTMIGALGTLQAESAEPSAQLATGLTGIGTGLAEFAGDGTTNFGEIGTLVADCYASGADPSFCEQLQATLGARAGQLGGAAYTAGEGVAGIQLAQQNFQNAITDPNTPAGVDPIAQLNQLIEGTRQFEAGITAFAGSAPLVLDGANQLAGGAAGLATGSVGLADGASQLATGTSALAESTPQLADGATKLADGAAGAADGSKELAQGLTKAADGIPNYTKAESERLASAMVAPVKSQGGADELFNASGVPLFAGIALWAGALAAFLLLAPLWRRTTEAARGVGVITMRSALPAVGIGALQGVIAGVVLPIALGYDFSKGAAFFGLAVLASVVFALFVQGLSALLGGFGRFVAFGLLVVSFAVGIISTVPGPLQAISDSSPIGAAFAGFQAVAVGAAGAAGAALVLALWGLGGLALTAIAVARARKAK